MNVDELLTKRDLAEFEKRLYSKLNEPQDRKKPRRYLRTKDIQELYGISASTVQNLRNQGKISFQKIGGTIIYDLEEIESALINQPGSQEQKSSKS